MATLAPSTRSTTITLASASAGPFLVGFRLFDPEGLNVFVDGEEPVGGWSVNAAFDGGYDDTASIELFSDAPAGSVITIEGRMTPERQSDYMSGDPGLTRKLNIELPRIWAVLQEQDRGLLYSLKTFQPARPFNIPAGRALMGAADGRGIIAGPTGGEIENAQGYALSAAGSAGLAAGHEASARGYKEQAEAAASTIRATNLTWATGVFGTFDGVHRDAKTIFVAGAITNKGQIDLYVGGVVQDPTTFSANPVPGGVELRRVGGFDWQSGMRFYVRASWRGGLIGQSPEDFGAKGDGVADDTAALAAWLLSGRKLTATLGAVYRMGAAIVGGVRVPAGITVDWAGATLLYDYTDASATTQLFMLSGSAMHRLRVRFNGIHYCRRFLSLASRCVLSDYEIIADTDFPLAAMTSLRDGTVGVQGTGCVLRNGKIVGARMAILMHPDVDTRQVLIEDTFIDRYVTGIRFGGAASDYPVILNATFGDRSSVAATEPGHNAITGGGRGQIIDGIRIKGSGEHAIYQAVADGTKGGVIRNVVAEGSGQCNYKARGWDGLVIENFTAGETSVDNSPGTNEDILHLEYCRNMVVRGVSSMVIGGYDGIFLGSCWNIDFFDVKLMPRSRAAIRIEELDDVADYTSQRIEGIRFHGLAVRNLGSKPLVSLGSNYITSFEIGSLFIDGLDVDAATGALVAVDAGILLDMTAPWQIAGAWPVSTGFAVNVPNPALIMVDLLIGQRKRAGTLSQNWQGGDYAFETAAATNADGAYGGLAVFSRLVAAARNALGGGIVFNRPSSPRRGAMVAVKQTGDLAQNTGLSFSCGSGTSATDLLVERMVLDHSGNLLAQPPGPFANDAAAATAGVGVGQFYRVTGGAIAWRQA